VKLKLSENSYLTARGSGESVILSVQARKDDKSVILMSVTINQEELDKLISELVSLRSKI